MPSAFIIINQTTEMKKKRITYGVYGMMEYQAIIKIGRATLKVLFTDGSMTAIGQNPAQYTTSDFLVQHAIENSSDFKRGRIQVVNTIELDEEVRIERNPAKASTQSVSEGKPIAEAKPNCASVSLSKPVAAEADSKETTDEPTEEAVAGVETPTPEIGIEPIEDKVSSTEEDATEEKAAEGETEVEFTTNQEAKDYLAQNFGVKSVKTRDEIKAVGATYGVKITFANEKD